MMCASWLFLLLCLTIAAASENSTATSSSGSSSGSSSSSSSSGVSSGGVEVSEPGAFVLHTWIERAVSALRVEEQFVATPVRNHVWRDLLFECRLKNVTGSINGVALPVEQHLLDSGFVRMRINVGNAPGPMVHVRLGYTMVDSVLPVGRTDQFAVVLGVPPCTKCACPDMSMLQVDVLIPANVTDVTANLHVPANMFKSLPLSGAPSPPDVAHSVSVHSNGLLTTSRIQVLGPTPGDVLLDSEPIATTPPPSPDGVSFVVHFRVDALHFHVGTDNCFPSEYITTVLSEGQGSAGGADLMLELGLAIVLVCAGIPCMCGLGCWLWVRYVQKQKAPKARGTGISSFSFGSGSQNFYEIVNHDNEQTIDSRNQNESPVSGARMSARTVL